MGPELDMRPQLERLIRWPEDVDEWALGLMFPVIRCVAPFAAMNEQTQLKRPSGGGHRQR